MTLPQERTHSMIATYLFLRRLSTPYDGGIKGVKKEIRQEARALLRHYPTLHDISTLANASPDLLWVQPT